MSSKAEKKPTIWKGRLDLVLELVANGLRIRWKPYVWGFPFAKEDIVRAKSKLDLDCFGCGSPYNPTIDNFRYGKDCRCWSDSVYWRGRLDRLLVIVARRMTSDGRPMYSASRQRAEDIDNNETNLDLDCLGCERPYNPMIKHFIHGTDCPCWSNLIRWRGRLDLVLAEVAKHIQSDGSLMYGTSRQRAENIDNNETNLDLDCLGCERPYNPTIKDFIKGTDCPCWSNLIRWRGRLDLVLAEVAKRVQSDGSLMYGTSRQRAENIDNHETKLDLDCLRCKEHYNPTIDSFTHGANCPCWSDRVMWKGRLDLILAEVAKHITSDGDPMYSAYRQKAEDIEGSDTKLDLDCFGCDYHIILLYLILLKDIIVNVGQKRGFR